MTWTYGICLYTTFFQETNEQFRSSAVHETTLLRALEFMDFGCFFLV